jgi:hypothetical protein
VRRLLFAILSGLLGSAAAVTACAQTNAPARLPATNAPAPVSIAAPAPAPVVAPAAPDPGAPTLPDASATGFWQRELATARRIVGGQTYDITSLVRWHMQSTQPAAAERPLKAWVLVIGTVGPNTAYGWEVTGFVDGQRQPGPFILRNPPAELLADFNRRKAAHAALLQRQARLQTELKRAQDLQAETEEYFRRNALIRVAGDLLDMRGQAVKDTQADLGEADEALRRFDTGGLDMAGPFVLRCFAMKTGLGLGRKVIYDHGAVLK